jgi:hypothetical protein
VNILSGNNYFVLTQHHPFCVAALLGTTLFAYIHAGLMLWNVSSWAVSPNTGCLSHFNDEQTPFVMLV